MIGGLIPLLRVGYERHAVERTWWIDVTWFRTGVRIEIVR